ncbi:MAG: hypothetical protein BroJett039_11450 [Chloroflexota bacterium]|nr:MAG: hypothetical protein BroJett039_11450 [Chloroflexota bacterium]
MERKFVVVGSIVGIAIAIGLTAIRFLNSPFGSLSVEWFGNLAFLIVYSAPYILALIALTVRERALQAGIWLASALLAALTSVTAFSGVTLFFLIPAILLLIGGFITLGRVPWGNRVGILMSALLFIGLLAVGILSFAFLFMLPAMPFCWQVRTLPNGTRVIEPDPNTQVQVISSADGNVFSGTSYGSTQPLPDGSMISGGGCASDLITPFEALLSIGIWGLTFFGLWKLRTLRLAGGPILNES